MSIISDTLQTRLDMVGAGGYVGGLLDAATALGIMDKKLSDNQTKLLGWGVASGAVAVALGKGLVGAAQAAAEEAATFGRASGNFRGSFPVEELTEFSSGLQGLTGVADDSIAGFLGLLGTFGVTGEQAKQMAMPILNASEALKAQGVTTEQLAVQIGKAIQGGNLGALQRSGIFVDEARFKVDRLGAVIDALQKQGGNAAETFRKTLPGAMQAAGNSIGDAIEAIGGSLSGPLEQGFNLVNDLASGFAKLPGWVHAAAASIGVVAVGALSLFTVGCFVAAGANTLLTTRLLLTANAYRGVAAAATQATAAQATQAAGAAGGAGLMAKVGGLAGMAKVGGIAGLIIGAALAGRAGVEWMGRQEGLTGQLGRGLGNLSPAGVWKNLQETGDPFAGFTGAKPKAAGTKAAGKPQSVEEQMLAELKRANDLAEKQLKTSGSQPFGTKDLPGALQAGAYRLAKTLR